MKNSSLDYLRANISEFILDNDKVDYIMFDLQNILDHVFSAIMEQFQSGNDGSWEVFKNSEAGIKYIAAANECKSTGWIFEWLYKTMGEPNLDYIREVYESNEEYN